MSGLSRYDTGDLKKMRSPNAFSPVPIAPTRPKAELHRAVSAAGEWSHYSPAGRRRCPIHRAQGFSWATPLLLMLVILGTTPYATAGPVHDAINERRANHPNASPGKGSSLPGKLPAGVTLKSDLTYGAKPRQRLDLYLPAEKPEPAPIIFMVHGGAWKFGDQQDAARVTNKVQRWVMQGFILVSVNYPMRPTANPLEQAEAVARALADMQLHAPEYRGDPDRVILMGHSAGAHLVCLISIHPDLATKQGAKPWLGAVALDSAAYDVVAIMQQRHWKLYDEAFGQDPAFWKSVSPLHVLAQPLPPLLAVCSSRRQNSIKQATRFAARALDLGSRVTFLPGNLSYRESNQQSGEPGAYTDAVETFCAPSTRSWQQN